MTRRIKTNRIAIAAMLLGLAMTVAPAIGSHSTPSSAPKSPPRPVFRVGPIGETNALGGFAFVNVTIRCPEGARLWFDLELDQDLVATHSRDYDGDNLRCNGGLQRRRVSFSGRFRPGEAHVEGSAEYCHYYCAEARVERFIILRHPLVPVDVPV